MTTAEIWSIDGLSRPISPMANTFTSKYLKQPDFKFPNFPSKDSQFEQFIMLQEYSESPPQINKWSIIICYMTDKLLYIRIYRVL